MVCCGVCLGVVSCVAQKVLAFGLDVWRGAAIVMVATANVDPCAVRNPPISFAYNLPAIHYSPGSRISS